MARTRTANEGGSRHGKHADNAYRVSLYLSAKEKAIAVLAAELADTTLTDVLRNGLFDEATRLGIMSGGQVTDKFRLRVNAYKQVLEAERKARKEYPT